MKGRGRFLLLFFLHIISLVWSSCPGTNNPCSLHGECIRDPNGDYCNCEWGWADHDCTKKMCPYGSDPLVSNDQFRIIRLSVSTTEGKLDGMLHLVFGNHMVEMPANGENMRNEDCSNVFRLFQNIQEVSCQRISTDRATGSFVFDITIKKFPIDPIMNNLYYHNGNPPISQFACQTDRVTGTDNVQCTFTDIQESNIPFTECSNHGRCNSFGKCECESGYYGENCASNKDDGNVLSGISNGPFFTGNLLYLTALRSFSSSFYIIHTAIGSEPVFTIDGMGETTLWRGSVKILAGDVVVDSGDLKVNHGNFHMGKGGSIEMKDGTIAIHNTDDIGEPILSLVSEKQGSGIVISTGKNELQIPKSFAIGLINTEGALVYGIDYEGNVSHNKGSFSILSDEGLKVSKINVLDGQNIHSGGLTIKSGGLRSDGIDISGDLNIDSGNVNIRCNGGQNGVSIENEGNGELKHSLQMILTEESNSFLRATKNDYAVFEILSDGKVQINEGGMEIQTGGLLVKSGGIRVQTGGLELLQGDLKILSGSLKVSEGGFHIENGGFRVVNQAPSSETLRVISKGAPFTNSSVIIDLPEESTDSSCFLEMRSAGNIISSISSRGKAIFNAVETQKLLIEGDLSINSIILRSFNINAGEDIVIVPSASFVRIENNGRVSSNRLELPIGSPGQILLIYNDDEEAAFVGEKIKIMPHSISMLIYGGSSWSSLTATSINSQYLKNVEEFTAANDLNIGPIKVTAAEFQAGKCPSGHVALYGEGGLITYDEAVTFVFEEKKLKLQKAEISSLTGVTDASQSVLVGPTIQDGKLHNVAISATELYVSKEVYIESSVFIGGSLSVRGTVMGSGAYVDASDRRFKRAIRPIKNASLFLSRLQGKSYTYRKDDKFAPFNFPSQRTFGFIAQEVEQIMPSVVHHDENGYRYIAYSQLIPVLTEGWKTHESNIHSLNERANTSDIYIKHLEETVQNQQAEISELKTSIAKLRGEFDKVIGEQQSSIQLLFKMIEDLERKQADVGVQK